jgi:hypothetical protein
MHSSQNNEALVSLLPKAVSDDFLRLGGASGAPLQSIEKALQIIGIIPKDEKLLHYSDKSEWRRGGAETYISDFEAITLVDGYERRYHIIAKAIVKWSSDLDRIAAEWIKRQERLNAFGVNTPRHHAYWRGLLFQQFITFSLEDYFKNAQPQTKLQLALELFDTAVKVDRAGFQPSSFVHDLRTDGLTIFVVDLGEDLGHFSVEPSESVSATRTLNWLKNNFSYEELDIEAVWEKANECFYPQ